MLIPVLLLAATSLTPRSGDPPYRQPQVAAARGMVAMAFGSGTSVWFTSSRDGGRTFAEPVKVADNAALALGRHRGPRIAIAKDAVVITAAAGDKPGQPGNLLTWFSTDDGKTWQRGGVVNDLPGSAREGLHAMAATPDGSVLAVWLDLRAQGTRLYGARSSDGGRTWSKNVEVYASPGGTICQCCHPSLATGEGRIALMWRNVMGGSRDLYFASSADGVKFDGARKLGEGTWKLDACPMDGGGIAVTPDGVASAWRREGDIYLAEAGGPERRVGAGKDPAMARTALGTFAAWTGRNGSIELLRPGAAAPRTMGEGGFANLVALPDGPVLLAWEEKAGIGMARIE